MVTRRTLGKYIEMAPEIAQDTKVKTKDVERVLKAVELRIENGRRKPKTPPPKDGISLRKASKKYDIPDRTIGRWAKRGLVPILLATKNEVYIDEIAFANIAKTYKARSNSKRRALKTILASS